jgi:hypothetical protein
MMGVASIFAPNAAKPEYDLYMQSICHGEPEPAYTDMLWTGTFRHPSPATARMFLQRLARNPVTNATGPNEQPS